MAEPVRDLSDLYHCHRLGCTLSRETCGKRHQRAKTGHLPAANYTCGTCPDGARHARECAVELGQRRKGFLLNIAKARGAEAKARRKAAKTKKQTYPEQVREADQILAKVDARRQKRKRPSTAKCRACGGGIVGADVRRRYCTDCRPVVGPGFVHGTRVVVSRATSRNRAWVMRCKCGREGVLMEASLHRGDGKTCRACATKAMPRADGKFAEAAE